HRTFQIVYNSKHLIHYCRIPLNPTYEKLNNLYLTFSKIPPSYCDFYSGFFDKFIIVLSGQILMTMNPDIIEPAEATKKEKFKEETRNINAAFRCSTQESGLIILPFFIISLVFATATFIGGYFVRMNVLVDSVIQSIVFVVTIGFFVLPLSWLFNKFWQLFLKK
ncbi:MAG: hypothetical protein KAQ70_07210, partial [Candidatus Heimdallarchaeota archaeon]|nr:hypothetical protein [Candidatus Heimdallarchaeota archaeon]